MWTSAAALVVTVLALDHVGAASARPILDLNAALIAYTSSSPEIESDPGSMEPLSVVAAASSNTVRDWDLNLPPDQSAQEEGGAGSGPPPPDPDEDRLQFVLDLNEIPDLALVVKVQESGRATVSDNIAESLLVGGHLSTAERSDNAIMKISSAIIREISGDAVADDSTFGRDLKCSDDELVDVNSAVNDNNPIVDDFESIVMREQLLSELPDLDVDDAIDNDDDDDDDYEDDDDVDKSEDDEDADTDTDVNLHEDDAALDEVLLSEPRRGRRSARHRRTDYCALIIDEVEQPLTSFAFRLRPESEHDNDSNVTENVPERPFQRRKRSRRRARHDYQRIVRHLPSDTAADASSDGRSDSDFVLTTRKALLTPGNPVRPQTTRDIMLERHHQVMELITAWFEASALDALVADVRRSPRPRDGRPPRLRHSTLDGRYDLVAAHYLAYFVVGDRPRSGLSVLDALYRSSLQCFLICFYGHCVADLYDFGVRHPTTNLERFQARCNGLYGCNAVERKQATRLFHRRRLCDGQPTANAVPELMSGYFMERAPILRQLLHEMRPKLAPLIAKLGRWERPRPGPSGFPYLLASAYAHLDRVGAWYLKYFGMGRLRPVRSDNDRKYRSSHECLLYCYYVHCAGEGAVFRERYPGPLRGAQFQLYCNGQTCNYLAKRHRREAAAKRKRLHLPS